MKENTQKVKQLLYQTIRAMPQDFALTEARAYLNAALRKIEQVEKKRETRAKIENEQIQKYWPSTDIDKTLKYIDDMISEEKQKLQEIENKKKVDDGEDIQTIFG